MTRACAAIALALAGALGCLPWQSPTDAQKRSALDQWCHEFTVAASEHGDDPKAAYASIADHFSSRWLELNKVNRGLAGIYADQRYFMALRFARNDHHLPGWKCPALDKLTLQIAALDFDRDGRDPPTSVPIVVTTDGTITVDGTPIALQDFISELPVMYRADHRVRLYREGWQSKLPPHSKDVLDALIAESFLVELVPARRAP
jgi:hypothetical protein